VTRISGRKYSESTRFRKRARRYLSRQINYIARVSSDRFTSGSTKINGYPAFLVFGNRRPSLTGAFRFPRTRSMRRDARRKKNRLGKVLADISSVINKQREEAAAACCNYHSMYRSLLTLSLYAASPLYTVAFYCDNIREPGYYIAVPCVSAKVYVRARQF